MPSRHSLSEPQLCKLMWLSGKSAGRAAPLSAVPSAASSRGQIVARNRGFPSRGLSSNPPPFVLSGAPSSFGTESKDLRTGTRAGSLLRLRLRPKPLNLRSDDRGGFEDSP